MMTPAMATIAADAAAALSHRFSIAAHTADVIMALSPNQTGLELCSHRWETLADDAFSLDAFLHTDDYEWQEPKEIASYLFRWLIEALSIDDGVVTETVIKRAAA